MHNIWFEIDVFDIMYTISFYSSKAASNSTIKRLKAYLLLYLYTLGTFYISWFQVKRACVIIPTFCLSKRWSILSSGAYSWRSLVKFDVNGTKFLYKYSQSAFGYWWIWWSKKDPFFRWIMDVQSQSPCLAINNKFSSLYCPVRCYISIIFN